MAGDASAYAALGLMPGADGQAIERAYKRLIKQHHPDREGGDSARAAEIIRAYHQLRRRLAPLAPQDTLILVDDPPTEERRGGWMRVALVLLFAPAALLAVTGPGAAYLRQLVPSSAVPHPSTRDTGPAAAAAPAILDSMDRPLHADAVDAGVRQAVQLLREHDEPALVSVSRECHRSLREAPSMPQLDRCAAFDDAVVQLQNRDPMWDEGPFSQIAVTSRQWSDAAGLSNDYLAIDSRLDRIRVQVELALAPPRLQQAPSLAPVDPAARAALTSSDANVVGVIPPARPDGNAALPDQ